MGLYSRLFDYIVACINKLLSFSRVVYGESSTIGILDIFGFECLSGKNSFEQVLASLARRAISGPQLAKLRRTFLSKVVKYFQKERTLKFGPKMTIWALI